MVSPFPGMDPYLERRATWPDLHQTLITYIREDLQRRIRPKYVARIGERVQLLGAHRAVVPDVLVIKQAPAVYMAEPPTAIADEPETYEFVPHPVPYLEILETATGDVVTMIEVLSPANKEGRDREQYLQKQREILASDAHFVEIDLLGYGLNTVLARNIVRLKPENWRYVVNVSRAERRDSLDVYSFSLQQRMPRVSVPLRKPDPDVVLDLPTVFNRCYEMGGYDLIVDYSDSPQTPLSEKESIYVANLVKRTFQSVETPTD